MILSKRIEVTINKSNRIMFHELGYDTTKESIMVDVNHLTKSSNFKIEVKCDFCPNTKYISMKAYNKSTNNKTTKYYCIKCSKYKTQKTNLERYGTTCSLNHVDVKNKAKTTLFKNYGTENPSQSNIVKERVKKTCFEKYGTEYYLQSEDKITKSKITNIEKYGTEIPSQNEDVKSKARKTFLERYGVEHALQKEEFLKKSQETLYNNYGVTSPLKNKEIFDKLKKTNIERYGTKYVLQNDKIKSKIKETNIEKYGIPHTLFLENTTKRRNESSHNPYMISKYTDLINDDYDVIDYKDSMFSLLHKNCGSYFTIKSKNLYERLKYDVDICTSCNPINNHTSNSEIKIREFVSTLFDDIIISDRKILNGKELDIYIPEKDTAIEFNGLYFHDEKTKSMNYHLDKTLKCQEKGIHLLHIWEDEWLYKRDIVKSIIKNKLDKIDNKIYARKCKIREVESNTSRVFLDDNHIQGFAPSTYKIGLYYEDELVSLMTFGYRFTNSKKEFELIRFCNKINTNVIGASSKLFKYFLNNYEITSNEIISYSDMRLFHGNMYETIGFEYLHLSKPELYWHKNLNRYNRQKFQKHKLVKEGFDKNKTSVEIMHSRGYYRIYGCGQKKWNYKINK